jgi:hypothetical protein
MTTDMQANLIQEQIAALNEYRDLLTRCQAENEKLCDVLKFYADWKTYMVEPGRVWKPIDRDGGQMARDILVEVFGNGRSEKI